VQETEGGFASIEQTTPVAANRFKQVEGADDVGLHKVARSMDGAVHMALSRKVDDGTGLVFGQQGFHQSAVTNVPLHKNVAWVTLQAGQGLQVARVSELVEVDHWLVRASDPVEHEICTNEAGAAGNEDRHDVTLKIMCRKRCSV